MRMIVQLRGTVAEATLSTVVLDVSGVGFELGISGTTAASLPPVGAEAMLYVRMQVREDAMTLFGFATREERSLFDHVVSVSGVGPKLALSVLSTFSVADLYTVVMTDDAKRMATVPGVGKKTAQRLILELKSTFEKDKSLGSSLGAALPSQLPLASSHPTARADAQAALLSMGFTPQEAELALAGYDDDQTSTEDMLTGALKRLGMGA